MSAPHISDRDRRALIVLGVFAVLTVLYLVLNRNTGSSVVAPSVSETDPRMAQQRLARLRQVAATVPSREAVLKQTSADLADRERGIIQADTMAQAQASLVEIARRVGKGEDIDLRGGDFGAPKLAGDYGLVFAAVTFDCRIEQLVNFLADLSKIPELVVPYDERIAAGNPKDKTMNVRVTLAGVVAKKLVPEKKGLAGF